MNSFIARGIIKFKNSKIKRFVYGYYIKLKNKHYILPNDLDLSVFDIRNNLIEIIKKPDKWTGHYDIEGKRVWERDKGILPFENDKLVKIELDKDHFCWINCREKMDSNFLHRVGTNEKGQLCIKVIGNIHNIKEYKDE